MSIFHHIKNVAKIGCLAFFVIAAGCDENKPPVSAQPDAAAAAENEKLAAQQRLFDDMNRAIMEANDTLAAGHTNAAIAQVESAFANPRFADFRPQILNNLLDLMQRCADDATLRKRAYATWNEPALAQISCEFLHRLYRNNSDTARAADWSAEILACTNLPPNLRRTACNWNLDDHIALKQDDQALATLETASQIFSPAENVALVSQAVESFYAAGRLDAVARVLTFARNLKPSSPALANLILTTQMRLHVSRGEWQELAHGFVAAATTLPDAELARMLNLIATAAKNAHQAPVLDGCAEAVLFTTAHTNAAAVECAANLWTENVLDTDKGAFPGRLDALLRAKIPARFATGLFVRHFYDLIENPVAIKEMMTLANRLVPLAENADIRSQIQEKMLDGYFLAHDYDRAIALLQAGIPPHDAAWHHMMIAKLKAYQALDRKDAREAVKQFSVFAEHVRKWKDAEVFDPASRVNFPKEIVLAHNAKRIGDILAGIPDAAGAAKSYAETRDLYRQALAKAKDPAAKKIIAAEMSRLPE